MKTSRLISLSFLAFCLPFFTQAQLNLDIYGGATISRATKPVPLGDDVQTSGFGAYLDQDHIFRPDFHLGVRAGKSLSEKWGLNLALEFANKGLALANTEPMEADRFRVSFLQLMPGIRYSLSENFELVGGLPVGLSVFQNFRTNGGSWAPGKLWTPFNPVDLGISFEVLFHINPIFLRAGFQHGLVNSYDIYFSDMDGNELEKTNSYNQSFFIGVGYRLLRP